MVEHANLSLLFLDLGHPNKNLPSKQGLPKFGFIISLECDHRWLAGLNHIYFWYGNLILYNFLLYFALLYSLPLQSTPLARLLFVLREFLTGWALLLTLRNKGYPALIFLSTFLTNFYLFSDSLFLSIRQNFYNFILLCQPIFFLVDLRVDQGGGSWIGRMEFLLIGNDTVFQSDRQHQIAQIVLFNVV